MGQYYFFVKNGMIVSGKLTAKNHSYRKIIGVVKNGVLVSRILTAKNHSYRKPIGAEIIEGSDLTLSGNYEMLNEYVNNYGFSMIDEHTISVPFIFIHIEDAIGCAKMWTMIKLHELKIQMKNNGYTDRVAFLLLNNQVLPVRMRGSDGDYNICEYLDDSGRGIWIRASDGEIYSCMNDAFLALQNFIKKVNI